SEADATARDIIAGAGHADHFGHGLGHGLGLFIHEGPRLSPNAPEGILLQPGMVTTVEPGVYIPQWGGIRIEDLVLLVEGGIEMLSHCPKQPLLPLSYRRLRRPPRLWTDDGISYLQSRCWRP